MKNKFETPVRLGDIAAGHVLAALVDMHEGLIDDAIHELGTAATQLSCVENKNERVRIGKLRGIRVEFESDKYL